MKQAHSSTTIQYYSHISSHHAVFPLGKSRDSAVTTRQSMPTSWPSPPSLVRTELAQDAHYPRNPPDRKRLV